MAKSSSKRGNARTVGRKKRSPAAKGQQSRAKKVKKRLTRKERARKGTSKKKGTGSQQPAAKSGKKPRSMGCLDGAAKVLGEANGGPLSCKELVERMLAKGYWATKGKTPAATLYSAILREIQTKKKEARFVKVERGRFALQEGG